MLFQSASLRRQSSIQEYSDCDCNFMQYSGHIVERKLFYMNFTGKNFISDRGQRLPSCVMILESDLATALRLGTSTQTYVSAIGMLKSHTTTVRGV